MKFPNFSQWKQIFKVLKKSEKIAVLILALLAVTSGTVFGAALYINNTTLVPANGGSYVEGLVGQPRFINPIYGETNDIDRALTGLVFSGLMTYDQQGNLTEDLAKEYAVSADGRMYEFKLKDNVFWHDNKPLTADDVVFTIKTIQSSDYKSPLRANWIDVNVEKLSEKSVRFTLRSPYNSFLENLTVKILPKHVWHSISPENFALSAYNLQPIGSGPYQFVKLNQTPSGQIKTIDFQANRKYHNHPPFISNISFQFFENRDALARAANAKQVDGFTLASFENNQLLAQKEVHQRWLGGQTFSAYSFTMPRYVAVFFNHQKSSVFSDINFRKAAVYAVDTASIASRLQEKTQNTISAVHSPILPEFFGYLPSTATPDFDVAQAKKLLGKVKEKAASKKPAFQFAAYLKAGSKGSEVTQLQSCLAKLDESLKNILASETAGVYTTITEKAVTEFQAKYLPNLKPTGETGEATRKKLNELCFSLPQNAQPLQFTLVTVNQPQLVDVANQLKGYWEAAGVSVSINAYSLTEIKTVIKNRSYDALLYGETLGMQPDLYPFWHSSQKFDPGLNLSSYDNKQADQLLKEARETVSADTKKQKLERFQEMALAETPALFLYNPNYLYWVSTDIQGVESNPSVGGVKIVDPAKRFLNVNQWFVKTKRAWK